jgi:hypothetical protein
MNKAIDQAESKIMPVVAGAQAVLGGIATADRVLQNVNTQLGVTADRSLMNFDVPSSQSFVNANNSAAVGGSPPKTLEAALGGQAPLPAPAGTLPEALKSSGFATNTPGSPFTGSSPAGPTTVNDFKSVATPIAGPTTMISVVPPALLPANANQMLLNPMQSVDVARQAFQTLQPLTSAPLSTIPINTFGQK